MSRLARYARAFALTLVVVCAFVGAFFVSLSNADAQSWEEFYELGNESYNGKNYSEAVSNYVKAIQAAPASAQRAYLNCARAHNQLGQYQEAHQYYAWYLEMVPDDRKAKGELRRVRRKSGSDDPVSIISDTQKSALDQLQTAIEADTFVDADGGGALALYDVLLRTGYAAPDLASLQRRLAEGLMREALDRSTPEAGQPAPTLDGGGWQRVRRRATRAASFADAPVDVDQVEAISSLASGWQEYLKGDYTESQAFFEAAIAGDASLVAAHWGRALSVLVTDSSPDRAVTMGALDDAQAAFEGQQRSPDPFVPLLRSKVHQALGEHEKAAELLLDL